MLEVALRERLGQIEERLERAARQAGRARHEITLVAVSKRHSIEAVRIAINAGLCDFGENYVQEAQGKLALLTPDERAKTRWHLIGGLQSNKARAAVDAFDMVQTVDRLSLARALSAQALAQQKIVPVLVEVNLATTPGRAGVTETETLALCAEVAALPGLDLHGLMGIAPPTESSDGARPHFARLRGLFEGLPKESKQVLSMGMSGDFDVAVAEGATLVRIGTALFGARV